MAEIMGGSGWGLAPGDVKKYTDRLIDDGINMFVFHINQQHLSYRAITDWPPSIPCHQPWRGAFLQLTANMKKRAAHIRKADTLLICPVRGGMESFEPGLVRGMNEHDGSHQMISYAQSISENAVCEAEWLSRAGISFDITDERMLEKYGKFEDGVICLGNCRYDRAVIADGCSFRSKGHELLAAADAVSSAELISGGIHTEPWHFTAPKNNRYLIEIKDGIGKIAMEYICDCELVVSDPCQVILNDTVLSAAAEDEYGCHYELSAAMLRKGINTLILKGIAKAFSYLTGGFAVKNYYPYYESDKRQYITENGFYIAEPERPGNDFIISGYPFAQEPVLCEKYLEGDIRGILRFNCEHFAAAHIYLDDEDMGWVYSGCEEVPLNGARSACRVHCEVYQTAYNLYGSHHHLEGDRPLVSPAQFEGVKNFADTPFLPECTMDNKIRLVKWRVPEYIEIVR